MIRTSNLGNNSKRDDLFRGRRNTHYTNSLYSADAAGNQVTAGPFTHPELTREAAERDWGLPGPALCARFEVTRRERSNNRPEFF
jgi:hypothetical protein